jgi:hypothetical protein
MKLTAFHNRSAVKEKFLTRLRAHAEADEIVQGTSWEHGKGCAVGCTLHQYDHHAYEEELGIPEWLARVEDSLFEMLPNTEAKKFPLQFLEAIPLGADLEPVKWKFCAFLMKENIDRVLSLDIEAGLKEQIVAAIREVLRLHELEVKGEPVSARSAARSAAESAAWSAAWSAAESAAWSAAESAARSAAWSAARSAAWSAARSAAWSAAWSAAEVRRRVRLVRRQVRRRVRRVRRQVRRLVRRLVRRHVSLQRRIAPPSEGSNTASGLNHRNFHPVGLPMPIQYQKINAPPKMVKTGRDRFVLLPRRTIIRVLPPPYDLQSTNRAAKKTAALNF